MGCSRVTACVTVLSLALFGQAIAETPDPDPSLYTTDELVISATRTPEAIGKSAAAVTLLTREEILRSPYPGGHELDDLLRSVPGVQPALLSSRYNHPTAQSVTLNGLGSRRALVLLDGVPLNDGFGGWINWGLIPNDLERVEIVPGGISNLYGAWAMGGVIHVITRTPAAGTSFTLDSQAGSLSTYQQALNARYGSDRFRFSLGYRWFHTNGVIPVPEYQRGPVDRTNDSRHESFNGSLAWMPTQSTTLDLSGSYFHEDRTLGTTLSIASRTIGNVSVGLRSDQHRYGLWEGKLFGQWQTFRNLTAQIIPSPLDRQAEFQNSIQTIPSNDFGGSLQWTGRLFDRDRLVLGTDARTIIGQSAEQFFSQTAFLGQTLARGQQLGWGLFGEWILPLMDRWTVTPGVRADWWKNYKANIETPVGSLAPRDNVISVVNPKLSSAYQISETLRLGASVYQAFRVPTLNELYRGFGFGGFAFLPNDQLRPERLTGFDVKAEGELLPNRSLRWRLSAHRDEIKDQILFVTQSPLAAQRQNVGRTLATGGAVDLSYQVFPLLSLNLGYAYVDSVILNFPGSPDREGKRVPNVSPSQVTMGATAGRPDLLELVILGRYLSRQYADDANTQPVAGFFALDASLQHEVRRGIRLLLTGENLTDRQYIATQTGPVKTLGSPLLIMGGVRAEF
ncbi:MAG TPA: TonB-dependent receptor [Nitrospira sp.]|nr:TonB-dependent receptor [Nitrospira sp.]